LREAYGVTTVTRGLEVGLIDKGRVVTPKQEENRPLVTALSFIANFAVMLILAL
jgi:hypothetical protein